jgi:hypothetical protein
MLTSTMARTRPTDGPVLVRVDASDALWVVSLPPVPEGQRVGVTVGREDLGTDEVRRGLASRGYDLIAVVGGRRPGPHADLLVSASLRTGDERWFAALLLVASKVFDPSFGPVHLALHDELLAHLPDIDDRI